MKTLHKNGHPLIYLPAHAAAARETLRLYPAQSKKARFIKAALGVALRIRIPLPLRRQRPPEFDPRLIEWDGDRTGYLEFRRDRIGVFAGNPNAEGRRFIYLICDEGGRPIFLAKAGFEPKAIVKVCKEQEFLKAHASRQGLPSVQGVYSAESALGIVMPFYRGVHPQRKQDQESVGKILASWVQEGAAIPIGEIPAWRAMAAHKSASGMAEGVGKTLVQPVLGHGDLVPWNVLIESDGTWRVIDWERGQSNWVPGWDWFHFVIQPLILVKRVPGRQVIDTVAALFRSEDFLSYARQTGIEKIRWDLFRGYLIHALEVLKPTEGREALRDLIEMTKTPEIRNRISEAGHPSITEVVAVMQTPPPAHGQAIMNQYLLEGSYRQIRLHHVRMAFSEEIAEVGGFRWKKVTHLFSVLIRIIAARLRTKSPVLYYPPASPNMVPFLRDCVLLICTRWMFPRTVFHFHANGIAGLYARLSGVLKLAFRAAYMRPDDAIAISEYGKADGVFLNAREIRLIPNGIPDQAGNEGDAAGNGGDALDTRRSTVDSAAPTILFVGMVCEEKGVRVLLEACRILRDRGVDFVCKVVGRASSEKEEQGLRKFIGDHDLGSRVALVGPLLHEAKWNAYADADIFCFPTFYSAESFGLVAVEAMMSSLPVVATNWRGLPDIVEEGKTGYLVPPQDPEAVAQRLEVLIRNPKLRETMGRAGRSRYEEKYTVEKFRERMEEVLADAGKNGGSRMENGGFLQGVADTDARSGKVTFSIITPSLNQLDWLRLCVASVADQIAPEAQLNESKVEGRKSSAVFGIPTPRSQLPASAQSSLAIEHIIQDGGTPGIEEFAREIGAEFYRDGQLLFGPRPSTFDSRRYRLAIYSEPDAGMYDAINKGIARISGDLWAWINSDEQYLPGTLAYVEDWFSRHPESDILCGDALLLDEQENPLSYRRMVTPEWLHTRLAHLSNASCASFYRSSMIERGGAFNTEWRSIGDAEWMARLLKMGMRAKNCRRLLASYAFTGMNTSATPAAFAEGRRWASMPGAPSPWLRVPVVLWHRVRKFTAGAYWKRTITYALYEKGSKGRVTKTVKGLGWGWRERKGK